ncbi:hypothetical protein Zmor_024759 [Zophobas morio]|uniref:Uncharacterized protein n=1 Tax=Zophobas morio TaxID=2755281 RepID=A0AA38HZK2_9CUCU|nr:hypothetical protein Zmor_024759 [Zophobas morio]
MQPIMQASDFRFLFCGLMSVKAASSGVNSAQEWHIVQGPLLRRTTLARNQISYLLIELSEVAQLMALLLAVTKILWRRKLRHFFHLIRCEAFGPFGFP